MGGEQFSAEFTKLNPLQKVPVLVDGDFALGESRAILAYLVDTTNPGSDLYPADPKARALVDEKLFYDATIVLKALQTFVVRILLHINLIKLNFLKKSYLSSVLRKLVQINIQIKHIKTTSEQL